MRLWGFVGVALLACYRAPTEEACSITCTPGVANNCPSDLSCQGGYCVGPGQVCRPQFVQVAAGTGFACGIDDQGALWCWGSNRHHQISAGDELAVPRATRIDITRVWETIEAGGEHVCGIAAGRLYCWGENDHSEVSETITGDVVEPLEIVIAGATTFTAVSTGWHYTCAIADGTLYCWGNNPNGVLGDGTSIARTTPTPVMTSLADWSAVSTGSQHTCAISTSAGVHCWGQNSRGELGPVAVGTSQLTPVAVTLAGAPLLATSIASSNASSCAITPAQELYCWGWNQVGQLGDKRLVDPVAIPMSAEPRLGSDVPGWTRVVGAESMFCGIAGDTVQCWGDASAGGLGNGLWTDTRFFGRVIASGVRDLSVGWSLNPLTTYDDLELVCAVVGNDILCWGDNQYGQLGSGSPTMAITPTQIPGQWLDLSLGAAHGCAIGSDSILYCWGSTVGGQSTGFAYGTASPRTPCAPNPTDPSQPLCDVGSPRAIGYAPDPDRVVTGTAHTCALYNGSVSCWGTGLNGTATKRDILPPAGSRWKSLYQTGRNGQCGTTEMMATSPTYCFGSVFSVTSAMPTREAQLDGFTAIALGGSPSFGVFLDQTGALWGYGDQTKYQLGDGTTTPYAAFARVGTRTYTAISTRANETALDDANFVCGIRADQQVECWGLSSRGQTGVLTSPTTTPNEVAGISTCTSIATGVEHACAVCAGELYCWGDNRAGQLAAMPTIDPQPMPRKLELVLPDDPWLHVVAGARFTCARSTGGVVYCWGRAEHGGLGNGGTNANLPVVVRATQIN